MVAESSAQEYQPTIKDLPEGERPRERLEHYGANALSTGELLAILLRTGVSGENVLHLAERLLIKHRGLPGLNKCSFVELQEERGMGAAKATQIKAALELGKRLLVASPHERPQVKSPADAANLLRMEMGALEQERLKVMLLDTRNRVLKVHEVYKGSLNTSVVRVGEVFREAIRSNAASIIVVHNHPSGDPAPSPEDIAVTEQMVEAGMLLNIEVLDHLIIGGDRFISLKERGLGFS